MTNSIFYTTKTLSSKHYNIFTISILSFFMSVIYVMSEKYIRSKQNSPCIFQIFLCFFIEFQEVRVHMYCRYWLPAENSRCLLSCIPASPCLHPGHSSGYG